MRTSLRALPMALAFGGMLFASMAQADGLEYHGYVRTGVGGTSEGGNLQCFQGQWPIRAKYRLGNECDNYSEHTVALPFGDPNGVWYKYKTTLAVQAKGTQDAESTTDGGMNFLYRENYFSAGGFFGRGLLENASLWVGQRFYNRHDIHMNDYYYWNNSGPGAGIEEINAGPAKLAVAYFQNGGNANAADAVVGKRLALRFYDVDVNPGGKLEGEVLYQWGSTAGTGDTGKGTMLFLKHAQSGVLGGFNHVAFIWGNKLGSGGEWLPTYSGGGEAKGSSWRLHDHLSFNFPAAKISGTATASYARMYNDENNDNIWISFGVRPQYNFDNNLSLAMELGHDQGNNQAAGTKPKMTKLTIAPQVALASGVWSRPVLRAFVTHAKWNADAGTVANGVFGTKTSGTSFGLQAEAWW